MDPVQRPHTHERIEAAAGEHLADRLDALSRPLAERVLRRAIALQQESDHGPETISRRALEQIAGELGIDEAAVVAALRDELESGVEAGSGRWRRIAPERVTGGRVVDGDRAEVTDAVVRWMTRHEGMRPRSRAAGGGIRWEKDDRWRTALRQGLKLSRGTGTLRNLPSVVHRQTAIGVDEHLVEIDADTAIVGRTAAAVGGGLAAAGAVAGGAVAAGIGGGPDIVQFLAGFVPLAAAGAGSALAIARSWTSSVRKSIERALDGISNPDLQGRSGRPKPAWARALDDVADVVDDLLD